MDGVSAGFRALPAEAPLAMPVQVLGHASGRGSRRAPSPPSSPRGMWWRRLLVIGGAVVLTAGGAEEMHQVLDVSGLTPLEGAILGLFVVLFAWIALSLLSSVCGFVSLIAGGGRRLDGVLEEGTGPRVALLMPAYNEQPSRIMAALAVIHACPAPGPGCG